MFPATAGTSSPVVDKFSGWAVSASWSTCSPETPVGQLCTNSYVGGRVGVARSDGAKATSTLAMAVVDTNRMTAEGPVFVTEDIASANSGVTVEPALSGATLHMDAVPVCRWTDASETCEPIAATFTADIRWVPDGSPVHSNQMILDRFTGGVSHDVLQFRQQNAAAQGTFNGQPLSLIPGCTSTMQHLTESLTGRTVDVEPPAKFVLASGLARLAEASGTTVASESFQRTDLYATWSSGALWVARIADGPDTLLFACNESDCTEDVTLDLATDLSSATAHARFGMVPVTVTWAGTGDLQTFSEFLRVNHFRYGREQWRTTLQLREASTAATVGSALAQLGTGTISIETGLGRQWTK